MIDKEIVVDNQVVVEGEVVVEGARLGYRMLLTVSMQDLRA